MIAGGVDVGQHTPFSPEEGARVMPLTQLRPGSKLPSLRIPLPKGRGIQAK